MAGIGSGRTRRGDWTFFASMSLIVLAVVGAGFGPSYAASPPSGLPAWVHLHGGVMACWILLFAVQAALVRRRALPLHRTLGYASIGLLVLMLPLGVATDLLAIRRGATPPFFTPAEMLAADLCDLLLFTGLYAWALVRRRRGDWHKRLLLCATIVLTYPAIGRLAPVRSFGIDMVVPLSTGLLILLALVGPAYDLIKRRRVHPAYLWGVGLIVGTRPLHLLMAASPPVQALADAMLAAGR